MHFCRTWCAIVGLAAIAGCSRQETMPCEPDARYSTARSAPPVQIPDDLSPPDESDAMRLPPDVGAVASPRSRPGSASRRRRRSSATLGRSSMTPTRDEPRQTRREARRQARGETPAAAGGPARCGACATRRRPIAIASSTTDRSRQLLLRCSTAGIHARVLRLLYLGHPCPRLSATLLARALRRAAIRLRQGFDPCCSKFSSSSS